LFHGISCETFGICCYFFIKIQVFLGRCFMKQLKKNESPSSSIVSQANGLVSARYTLPLSEQRLVLP